MTDISTPGRTQELQRLLAWVSTFLFLALLVAYLAGLHGRDGWIFDGQGYVVGVDFLNLWMMGEAGLHSANPAQYYDISYYTLALREQFGAAYRVSQWSYPPSYMFVAAPFAVLPYYAALLTFFAATLALLAHAVRCVTQQPRGTTLMAILASPASCIALISGQITLAATALQLFFFHLLDKRPWLAGMLLGLLTLKPQLGLAYPFFLIATRRWKTFAGAAISSAVIVGLSIFIWGVEMWSAYREMGVPLQNEYVLKEVTHAVRALMPTIYMDLRIAGVGYALSLAGQALVALLAIVMFFKPRFRRFDAPTQQLMVAAASVLATPYLMAYDTLFLSAALVLWLRGRAIDRTGFWLCVGCFFLPVLHYVLGTLGIPGSALLPAALMLWLMRTQK